MSFALMFSGSGADSIDSIDSIDSVDSVDSVDSGARSFSVLLFVLVVCAGVSGLLWVWGFCGCACADFGGLAA